MKAWQRKVKEKRWERKVLLRQQEGKCSACGEPVELRDESSPRYATLDHTIALSNGGVDAISNMTIMHQECNQRKGAG